MFVKGDTQNMIFQCNEHCLRSVDSTCMPNVNNADYIDYVMGYSQKWQKTAVVVSNEVKLLRYCT